MNEVVSNNYSHFFSFFDYQPRICYPHVEDQLESITGTESTEDEDYDEEEEDEIEEGPGEDEDELGDIDTKLQCNHYLVCGA